MPSFSIVFIIVQNVSIFRAFNLFERNILFVNQFYQVKSDFITSKVILSSQKWFCNFLTVLGFQNCNEFNLQFVSRALRMFRTIFVFDDTGKISNIYKVNSKFSMMTQLHPQDLRKKFTAIQSVGYTIYILFESPIIN